MVTSLGSADSLETQSDGRAVRVMRRRAAGAASLAALVLVAAGALVASQAVTPLGEGSLKGPDTSAADTSFVTMDSDESPDGAARDVWVYCTSEPRDGAWAISLRNVSPLPVTVIGLDRSSSNPTGGPPTGTIDLRDLARFRPRAADGSVDELAFTDPRSVATLEPVDLSPGAEVDVWVRFGLPVLERDLRLTLEVLPVRVRVAGIERTYVMPLSSGTMAVDGSACAVDG